MEIKITEKKIDYDKEINNNKILLETVKKMKLNNTSIPLINDIEADVFLVNKIRELENAKLNKL